jgi:hypothetical protein
MAGSSGAAPKQKQRTTVTSNDLEIKVAEAVGLDDYELSDDEEDDMVASDGENHDVYVKVGHFKRIY